MSNALQKKKLLILGSTGNLGQQTLEVLEKYADEFEVVAITGNKNQKLLQSQAKKLNIKNFLSTNSAVALTKFVRTTDADIVVNSLSGIVGVEPTKAALKANKTLLLANKEALVVAGNEIMKIPNAHKNIIPLDSEHHAIYEILKSHPNSKIDYIILPCSGGPFLGKKTKELENMTATDALKHPRWNMGAKITIESATLLNKGMEVIEAHHLFGLPLNKIIVKIHPEAKIKGAVKFKDGKCIAYVSEKADMREHIEGALRQVANLNSQNPSSKTDSPANKKLSLGKLSQILSLPTPDHKTFPGIKIVTSAFKSGKNLKTFLKKEEALIDKFLKSKIKFGELLTLLSA